MQLVRSGLARRGLSLVALATVVLSVSSPMVAGAKDVKKKGVTKAAAKAAKPSGKLDIKDLEQKYWAPKDTDFSVVQNRTYSKANRYSVNVMTGPLMNDPYSSGFNHTLSGSYYFSERHGVEVSYIHSDLANSDATEEFRTLSGGGTAPDFGAIKSHMGVSYTFVPFYAKMSLLGKKIIYFDMAISPGIGMTSYESASKDGVATHSNSSFAVTLDVTQYFFLSRHIAIRLDLRNRWFKEKVYKYTTGEYLRNKNTNSTLFLFGGTYFF